MAAAVASECAADQGLFWPFHDMLFAHEGRLSREVFLQSAEELDLDMGIFSSCLDEGGHEERVLADVEAGRAMNVFGTPTVFVDGRIVSAFPAEALREAILTAARTR